MERNLIFRGRRFTSEEIFLIKNIIKQHWLAGRKSIAKLICERLNWRSLNGELKIIPCLEALCRMEQIGLFLLPKSKKRGGYHKIEIITKEEVNFKVKLQREKNFISN